MHIYLDNAATTLPVAGTPKEFYNPSSPHALGIKAERALRDARNSIAASLNVSSVVSTPAQKTTIARHLPSPEEITFTSGGTESNNLAILGYTLANQRHDISLASAPYEHPSILAPIRFAIGRGWASQGLLENATLISVSHVNHETGDINDISAIAASVKKHNPNAVIHVDGAQGFCKEPINFNEIDMYSFSGHKCHGPTGIGGLWVKKGVRLTPLQHGGSQENNLRAGTENISAIITMAEMAESLCNKLQENHAHVTHMKSQMLNLQGTLPDVQINTIGENVSPYILNMSFMGIKGEILVHALSEKGVYASMGAACNSRKRTQSALEVMGFPQETAKSAIRFSFSPYNTLEEVEIACEVIASTVKHLRSIIRK